MSHKEIALEDILEDHLLKSGYIKRLSENYDKRIGLDPDLLFQFLETTQNGELEILEKKIGENYKIKIFERLEEVIDKRGLIDTFRNGFEYYDVKLEMAYFKPATTLNPDTLEKYQQNIFSVIRQLQYSSVNKNSLDLTLFVNGFPLITSELKTETTGQNVFHAIRQYQNDRDPKELIFRFNKRSLVHFAVSTDLVYMTTQLKGKSTFFLPFNRGSGTAAGNPTNPNGHRTSYLWEDIWQPDTILDIIAKFIHVEEEEKEDPRIPGRYYTSRKLLFPRYHQLDVVRSIVNDVKINGSGDDYLVQHSAGSGKSNSIAWLVYQLSNLHNDENELIFNSTIVVTDRVVLDRQLQETIYQFDHKRGVVQKIDESSDQLKRALQRGTKIIITTIHKFPYVLEYFQEEQASLDIEKKYAIVIDEAHSSQSGDMAKKLLQVLFTEDHSDDIDSEEAIKRVLDALNKRDHISYFAFTATPKSSTLEKFGHRNQNGEFVPFHLYSMRQAIEEGFILDVLENYTTYTDYYKLNKVIEDDPELNEKKAKRALVKFLQHNEAMINEKSRIIIDHFISSIQGKIGGRAKAMVVTSSRLQALKFYKQINLYLDEIAQRMPEMGRPFKILVAFSGTLKDPDGANPDEEFTEEKLNGFAESELPEKFSSDEYKILVVANKYQTGFDQPLLHTMYVNKVLRGVTAVQTLSRLNRTHLGKDGTFVLDFVNDPESIKNAFQPFYEQSFLDRETDPNVLSDMKLEIYEGGIILEDDVNQFAEVFYKPKSQADINDTAELNALLDPAVIRFEDVEDEEEQEKFRGLVKKFRSLYNYLSQIMPFQSPQLEKLSTYVNFLIKKLPKRQEAALPFLDDDVELEMYKTEKVFEGKIELTPGEGESQGPISTNPSTRVKDEKTAKLSEIINLLNQTFGTEFTDDDRIFFMGIKEELANNPEVQVKAQSNNEHENFKTGIKDIYDDLMIDRLDSPERDTANKIMGSKDVYDTVLSKIAELIFDEFKTKVGSST